jgi:hypothetical protein
VSRYVGVSSDLLQALLVEDLGSIDDDRIYSDTTIEAAAKISLRNAFLKKYQEREAPDAETRALTKFLEFNERCRQFSLEPKRLYDEELIGEVKSILDDWLHPGGSPITFADIQHGCELGRGASLLAGSNCFYTKLFDSPLSTSNEALRTLYGAFVQNHPTWSQAEMARESNWGSMHVPGSKTTTVPKQFDIKRTICVEPVLEMFFQRGLGNVIEKILLKRLGISLSDQPEFNRTLAKIGSVDGSFGTIDLRSASDSISTTLIDSIFPRYFANWLKYFRCQRTTMPDGSTVELSMISSMGNGYTFPLQTMIFASIVVAVYRLKDRVPVFRSRYKGQSSVDSGVFGDDIVVRREMYDATCLALQLFGFEVNDGKSFNSGDFRESCGEDYFRGVDIRGVYVKSLATEQDCFSAVNRLVRWSARHKVNLDLVVSYLLGSVSFLPIPFRDGDDEGIKVPWSVASTRVTTFAIATRSPIYWARVAVAESFPVPDETGSLSAGVYQTLPYRLAYNGPGLLLALVGGFVRDGRVSVRSERKRSKVRQRSVPFWDYIPTAGSDLTPDSDWSTTVANYFLCCSSSLD